MLTQGLEFRLKVGCGRCFFILEFAFELKNRFLDMLFPSQCFKFVKEQRHRTFDGAVNEPDPEDNMACSAPWMVVRKEKMSPRDASHLHTMASKREASCSS